LRGFLFWTRCELVRISGKIKKLSHAQRGAGIWVRPSQEYLDHEIIQSWAQAVLTKSEWLFCFSEGSLLALIGHQPPLNSLLPVNLCGNADKKYLNRMCVNHGKSFPLMENLFRPTQ
jgi:hypothetical protein